MIDYFYDEQLRRYILQVTRMFGGFEVRTGKGGKNNTVQRRQVPVRYGETSRMVNHILRLNSENTILMTPIMSTHIVSINMAPDRRQNPTLVTTHLVDERKFDEEQQEYTSEIGDRFTLKRHMPVPYNITFQLDIWTSNNYEKMQIIEQIMMLFNPSVNIQTSDNVMDWSAITYAEMQDNITWSSRQVPYGDNEVIDVASMQFLIPAWINPPAELTERKAIETIINNVFAVNELPKNDTITFEEEGDLLTRQIITPGNHQISINGNKITLLGSSGQETDENGNVFSWKDLLLEYGTVEEGVSEIVVKQKFGDPKGISGKISFDQNNDNILIWEPNEDEIFAETLDPVDAIIDPTKHYPEIDHSGVLPPASEGQRYLIADDIPEKTGSISPWGYIQDARTNDIIEFNGTEWEVVFDASQSPGEEIVNNLKAMRLFRWNGKDEWEPAIDRTYLPGTWRVKL